MAAMTDLDIVRAIFQFAAEDSLIPVGAKREGKNGDLNVRYKLPVPMHNKRLLEASLEERTSTPHYISFATVSRLAVKQAKTLHLLDESTQIDRPIYFFFSPQRAMNLCGVVVDLDVGRQYVGAAYGGMTADEALDIVRGRVQYDELPEPSLIARSGRGAYVIWLLAEGDGGGAPLASKENVARFGGIARSLVSRLADIRADANSSTSCVHWFKAPGSVATAPDGSLTGRAEYQTYAGDLADVRRYSLHELADHAGVLPQPRRCPSRPPRPSERVPRERRRNVTPQQSAAPRLRRASEIEWVSELRNGLRQGCRHMALFYYSQDVYFGVRILRGHEIAEKEMNHRVTHLNRSFRPPLKAREVTAAMKWKRKGVMRALNATVSAALGVTSKEVEQIEATRHRVMVCLLPAELRAQRSETFRQKKLARESRRRSRKAFVLEELRSEASDAEIARRAAAAGHSPCSRQYVRHIRHSTSGRSVTGKPMLIR